MKNKKIIIAIFLIFLIAAVVALELVLYNKNYNDVPENYIAVFVGTPNSEITYRTYIYKENNEQANFGLTYINTTSNTISWGSPEWEMKVTGRGKVSWTDDVFKVAKENNAYSFVRLPNDDKMYTIEEFMTMFSMD